MMISHGESKWICPKKGYSWSAIMTWKNSRRYSSFSCRRSHAGVLSLCTNQYKVIEREQLTCGRESRMMMYLTWRGDWSRFLSLNTSSSIVHFDFPAFDCRSIEFCSSSISIRRTSESDESKALWSSFIEDDLYVKDSPKLLLVHAKGKHITVRTPSSQGINTRINWQGWNERVVEAQQNMTRRLYSRKRKSWVTYAEERPEIRIPEPKGYVAHMQSLGL